MNIAALTSKALTTFPTPFERLTMNKFRFERTSYGWKAYLRCNSAWLYFGHFPTQAKAMLAFNTGEQP